MQNGSSYRDLQVWQLAMDLVQEAYALTFSFPKDERFGMVDQIRRAAVSIPSNIAEGSGRRTPKDFVQFLGIANGSLRELETLILLSERLGYCNADEILRTTERIGMMITKLRQSLLGPTR